MMSAFGEADMVALGALIGAHLPRGVVFLEGQLGAGKTTLTRGILQAFGHSGSVKSPTYTLVEPYNFAENPVYHFDLYRLGDPEELEYMGIRDYFDQAALCIIEWPNKGAGVLPEPDLRVTVAVLQDPIKGIGRRLALEANSALGQTALAAMAKINA
ncbi:tRNA (adenosine(37)-N6)-threonylcarbamoyltransferase complex ATPase subunit type 1 TsaE [Simiduia litorea]|uniref:tRNA (adenosine(37)-N6)-threonylcarbamoyltransferase complex ATPase subunit type 1 TsaE n=1 Tax=Simiduia litorea TaxID=1435348 RepID=UPI0036F38591